MIFIIAYREESASHPLPLPEGVPQVTVADMRILDAVYGAKHSLPGDRGEPQWSEGVPPVGVPVTPLIRVVRSTLLPVTGECQIG